MKVFLVSESSAVSLMPRSGVSLSGRARQHGHQILVFHDLSSLPISPRFPSLQSLQTGGIFLYWYLTLKAALDSLVHFLGNCGARFLWGGCEFGL